MFVKRCTILEATNYIRIHFFTVSKKKEQMATVSRVCLSLC